MDSQLKPLQIPQSLLSKTKSKNKDTLLQKHQFQNIGGNSFIEIQPAIVKFTGYELDKINSITIKIINKAPISQRIHILPNPSQNFSVKLDKKGILASGMSENLEVQFKSSEYKYYYQTLKINTETDNFLIPMHAYPAMSQTMLRQLFPKVIDFGMVQISQTQSNKYPIVNKIPLNFEFQFVILKNCQQITIEPLTGIVPGKGLAEVQISFSPKQKITYNMQVQLRISQFDFQNMKIKIVGNGKGRQQKKRPSSKIRTINTSNKDYQNTNSKLMNNTHNKLRNSIKDLQANMAKQTNNNNQSKLLGSLVRIESSGMFIEDYKKVNEKEFIERYNQIMGLDKQKDIKFAVFNGDTKLNQQQIKINLQKRNTAQNQLLQRLQKKVNQRIAIEINSTPPIVNLQTIQKKIPVFSTQKNDELKKRRNYLKKLMEVGSKIILQNRMLKRLKKIKLFLVGCKSKQEVQRKIDIDHQSAKQILNSGQDYVKFQFQVIDNFDIDTFKLQFLQNTTLSSIKPFKIQPLDQFDDLNSFQLIPQNQVDIMGYTNIQYPLGFINLNKLTPLFRQSCQQQKPFRGATIPPITESLSKLSKTYQLPLDLPPHKFIVESNLKRFKKQTQVDQKSIQYLFNDQNPVDDQFIGWTNSNQEPQILKAKFMRNLGFQYTTFSGFVNSDFDVDVGFVKNIHKYCPKIIKKALQDDPFSQNDSDNDEYPTMNIGKLDEYLKKIEGDNKQLIQKRAENIVVNLNNRKIQKMINCLQVIKKKNLITAITKQVEYNKWAVKQKNIII